MKSRLTSLLRGFSLAAVILLVTAGCTSADGKAEQEGDAALGVVEPIVARSATIEAEPTVGYTIKSVERIPTLLDTHGQDEVEDEIIASRLLPTIYFGEESLDSRIANAEVIVRATLRSITPTAERRLDFGKYVGTLEFTFDVIEYLKGSGGTTVVAVASDVDTLYDNTADALTRARELITERDTQWDTRETLLFLKSRLDLVASTAQANRYDFGISEFQYRKDTYSIASKHSKIWLPEAMSGTSGAVGASSEKYYLTDVPSVSSGTSGASGTQGSTREQPNMTLSSLKARLAEIEAEITAGGGSTAFRECVQLKYFLQSIDDGLVRQRGEQSWHLQYKQYDRDIASGLPAGAVVYASEQYDLVQTGQITRQPSDLDAKIGGRDLSLFGHLHPYRVVTARPLPAGDYQFHYGVRGTALILCKPTFPDDLLRAKEIFLTVTAPYGVLHEALFDPVTIGTAVGADASNGVLKPAAFIVGSTSTSITGLKWESNSVVLTLSPHMSLSDQRLDFIELDGTVGLSLSASSATVDSSAGTLTWNVAEQPWENGDQLMLRIGVPNTAITLEGLAESLSEGSSDAFTVSASDLTPTNSYSIRLTTDNSNTGFNSTCTDNQEDVSVPSGNTSHTATLTLHGCTAPGGTVTATLLQGSSTVATDTAQVTVTTPVPASSVEITGLLSSMEEGESDSFAVSASNLISTNTYTLRVTTDNSNTGFDSGCTDVQEDVTISQGSASHTASLTLHGCTAPGGTVTATLLQGGTTVATETAEVTVTAAVPAPEVEITDLVASIEEGGSDPFSVTAYNLISTDSYVLRVTADNSNTGFDAACTDRQEDVSITPGNTTHTASLTLHGCTAPGGTVTATLLQGTTTIATDTADVTVQGVTSSNVTVILSPREASYYTHTDITVTWTDPDSCQGRYFVGVSTSSGSIIRILGFHPAPATTTVTADLSLNWDTVPNFDWTVGVWCYPSDPSMNSRMVGEVPLQSGLPSGQ